MRLRRVLVWRKTSARFVGLGVVGQEVGFCLEQAEVEMVVQEQSELVEEVGEGDNVSDTASRSLAHEISHIQRMDRAACLLRWRDVFGRSPPKHLSLPFLRRVLIWEVQTRMLGGLSAKTERRLNHIARAQSSKPIALKGAHLVREWNGRSYHVEVVENGYVMDGKTWTSLTALAYHITGTRWSGPRFFGVQR